MAQHIGLAMLTDALDRQARGDRPRRHSRYKALFEARCPLRPYAQLLKIEHCFQKTTNRSLDSDVHVSPGEVDSDVSSWRGCTPPPDAPGPLVSITLEAVVLPLLIAVYQGRAKLATGHPNSGETFGLISSSAGVAQSVVDETTGKDGVEYFGSVIV